MIYALLCVWFRSEMWQRWQRGQSHGDGEEAARCWAASWCPLSFPCCCRWVTDTICTFGDVFWTRVVMFCCVLLSDGDPKNYMAYYRRATVFLAMGKSKSALPDLSRVIELKPDFTSVSLHLITIAIFVSFITNLWLDEVISLRAVLFCTRSLVLCKRDRIVKGNTQRVHSRCCLCP